MPKFVAMTVLFLCFSACSGEKSGRLIPASSGKAYEILVVADAALKERPAGQALFRALETEVPGLPQSESAFRTMYSEPVHYDATLKLVRNIIEVDIDSKRYSVPTFKYAKDVYAEPQAILTIQAPDEASFAAFVNKNARVIVNFFTRVEMNRQIEYLEEHHSEYASVQVRELFGCDVWIPSELTGAKVGKHFLWMGMNSAVADKNFVMYSYPYTGEYPLTKARFIHQRDSVMKVNIPGAEIGMYMMTDSLHTDVQTIDVRGAEVTEARGLWQVKGDFMGGPFVSHAHWDGENKRIVVAEVFVYAPGRMKRNLMRQMEASLYTLRLLSMVDNDNE